MKTAIAIGCLAIAGVQLWLAYRVYSTKNIAEPVKRKARMLSLERTSRAIQVAALFVVCGYWIVTAMTQ